MEMIHSILDAFLHLDKHLAGIVSHYGALTYLILFLIVFTETGLIVMPLLPGDSLLFAAGALCALPDSATGANVLNILFVIPLLIVAALLGDNVNYFVGHFLGERIKKRKRILFFKSQYISDTEVFYEKHGGKTVVMARFVPIVRTMAPFVAGAGSMKYSRYILFCFAGAVLWVVGLSMLGYLFGNIPFVKKNFELVIFGIIFLSLLPMVFAVAKSRINRR